MEVIEEQPNSSSKEDENYEQQIMMNETINQLMLENNAMNSKLKSQADE